MDEKPRPIASTGKDPRLKSVLLISTIPPKTKKSTSPNGVIPSFFKITRPKLAEQKYIRVKVQFSTERSIEVI